MSAVAYGRDYTDDGVPVDELDGAAILDDILDFVRRYVVFSSRHDLVAVVLWIAHTHAVERFYITPRLLLDSAEPGSGKTRVLELMLRLAANAKMSVSTTPAAIFRRLDERMMTLLMDEIDNVFHAKASGNELDLLALLNSGYKRGATIDRCVGDAKSMKVQEFEVYAPVALAGLAGHMPRALVTRSVVIHMRKRAPGETVEPFYEEDAEYEAEPIRQRLADWITSVADELGSARPKLPEKVVDRPAELWKTLVAVADAAGGDWPERARDACRHHVLDAEPEEQSLGVRLLADLRGVFGQRVAMRTAAILDALHDLDEAPWRDLWGKALDARRLAKELGRYGVKSTDIRDDEGVAKGYRTDGEHGLTDAWRRYLTPGATTATAATPQVIGLEAVADASRVADANATGHLSATGSESLTSTVAHVAPVAPQPRQGRCRLCNRPADLDGKGYCLATCARQ